MKLKIKRVYATPANDDGKRILVDRIWPRGLSKDKAKIDSWLKEIAPSDELRKWFSHDPAKWHEFQRRYKRELDANPGTLNALLGCISAGPVTILYSAKNEQYNNAMVLSQYLESRLSDQKKS